MTPLACFGFIFALSLVLLPSNGASLKKEKAPVEKKDEAVVGLVDSENDVEDVEPAAVNKNLTDELKNDNKDGPMLIIMDKDDLVHAIYELFGFEYDATRHDRQRRSPLVQTDSRRAQHIYAYRVRRRKRSLDHYKSFADMVANGRGRKTYKWG